MQGPHSKQSLRKQQQQRPSSSSPAQHSAPHTHQVPSWRCHHPPGTSPWRGIREHCKEHHRGDPPTPPQGTPPRDTHSPPLPALHFPLQSPPALHPPKIHQGHQNHRSGAPSHGPMPLPPGVADPEMLETSNREPRPSVNSPQHHKSKLKPICSPRAQPRDLPTSLGMRQAQGQPGNPTKVRSWITKV